MKINELVYNFPIDSLFFVLHVDGYKAGAHKINVGTSFVTVDVEDKEQGVNRKFVNELIDFHSGVRKCSSRALATIFSATLIHAGPEISKAQPSMSAIGI